MLNLHSRTSLRIGLLTLPFVIAACSLDDSVHIVTGPSTAGTGGASTTQGTGGQTMATSTSTASGGNAGASGAATTGMAGSMAGSAGTGGSGGSGGDTGGAGGNGGDVGGSGGNGGDMGGSGGSDMDASVPPVKSPTGIAINGANPNFEVHPSGGGSPFTDACGQNDVLIGFQGTMDAAADSGTPWLKSLTGLCGTPALMGTGPFTVAINPSSSLPTRGGVSDLPLPDAKCPQDQVIVAYHGNSGNYIDSVGFDCAPLLVNGDSTNGYTITIDMNNVTTIGPIGGTGGTGFGVQPCDPGQVADGTNVHAGAWFDGFGLTCGAVTLTGMRPRP
jgi:hypothetical protein